MLATKQLTVAIDSIVFFHTMEVNGYHQLLGYHHSLKYLPLSSTAERTPYGFWTT